MNIKTINLLYILLAMLALASCSKEEEVITPLIVQKPTPEPDQTLYSFRHTGAIDIYKLTGSIEKLKTAMGHSNIIVSLTYLIGLDVAELQEADMPN